MHLAQKAAGLVRVLFGDESGFTENPPLTQARAPKGEPHAHEMKIGTRARLNGIGCCDFKLKPVSMWFKEGPRRRRRFQGMGQCSGCQVQFERSNASLAGQRTHPHGQSHPGFISRMGGQGITYSFLSPYSPELNRIEILWRKIKRLRPFILLEIKELRITSRKILTSLSRKS